MVAQRKIASYVKEYCVHFTYYCFFFLFFFFARSCRVYAASLVGVLCRFKHEILQETVWLLGEKVILISLEISNELFIELWIVTFKKVTV